MKFLHLYARLKQRQVGPKERSVTTLIDADVRGLGARPTVLDKPMRRNSEEGGFHPHILGSVGFSEAKMSPWRETPSSVVS
jgi:hypothetical protein